MHEHTSVSSRWNAAGQANQYNPVLLLDRLYEEQAVATKSRVTQAVTFDRPIEQQLPKSAMALKEAIAVYAMHLSFADRDRLFEELDFLTEIEGWEIDDALPRRDSFVNFLKWAIEAKAHKWTSLSLDGDGQTVVAFANNGNIITAAFLKDGSVHWTSRISTQDGLDISAGKSPLRSFAQQTPAILGRL